MRVGSLSRPVFIIEVKMRNAIAIVLIVFLTQFTFAQDFILSNGMVGYTFPQYGTGMVAIVSVVKCGVKTETPSTNGLSHYLEHLLFNGTERFTQEEFYKTFDDLGIYANAQTGKDYIAFMMIGPVESADTIAKLLKEQLFFSIIPENKFEKEKGIVIQEMAKTELDDDYRFETLFDSWDKEGTPYAYPVLGTRASIQRIQRKEVYEYYKKWFHPNNMILLVSGDLSKSDLYKLAQSTFENIPAGDIPTHPEFKFLALKHNRIFSVERATNDKYRFHGRFGPIDVDSIQQIVALEIISELFNPIDYDTNSQFSEIQFSIFRDKNGVLFEFEGWSKSTFKPDTVLTVIKKTFNEFIQKDFNQRKLESFRLKKQWEERRAAEQIQYWGLMKAGKMVQNSNHYWTQYEKIYQSISVQEIVKYFQNILQTPYAMLYEVATDKEDNGLDERKAEYFNDSLSNGLKFYYRKSGGSKLVGGHILIKDRSEREPNGKNGIAEILHNLIQSNGPSTISKSKWQDTLARIGLVLKCADDPNIPFDDYYTTSAFSFIRFDVPEEFFNEAISLISEAMKNTRIDEASLRETKSVLIKRLQKESNSPKALASKLLQQKIYKSEQQDSPFGSIETVEGITVEDLNKFSREYFSANSIIITLDGNLEFQKVKSAILKSFEQFPSNYYEKKEKETLPLPSGRFEIQANKSQSYVILAGELYDLPDSLTALFENTISLLSKELQMRLREEKGWAYSLGANYKKLGNKILILLQIGCHQSVIDSAILEMKNVYHKILNEKIDSEEFNRVKNANQGRIRMREAGRQYRAFAMSIAAFNNQPVEKSVQQHLEKGELNISNFDLLRKKLPPLNAVFIVK